SWPCSATIPRMWSNSPWRQSRATMAVSRPRSSTMPRGAMRWRAVSSTRRLPMWTDRLERCGSAKVTCFAFWAGWQVSTRPCLHRATGPCCVSRRAMRWPERCAWLPGISAMRAGPAMAEAADNLFAGIRETARGQPLYLHLRRTIEEAVGTGLLGPGDALPSERDIAVQADISRVTVRKAVRDLVESGVLVQRYGSGTFVAPRVERVEQ